MSHSASLTVLITALNYVAFLIWNWTQMLEKKTYIDDSDEVIVEKWKVSGNNCVEKIKIYYFLCQKNILFCVLFSEEKTALAKTIICALGIFWSVCKQYYVRNDRVLCSLIKDKIKFLFKKVNIMFEFKAECKCV